MTGDDTIETSPVPNTLDLRGLKCPLPVLRTRKALAALAQGADLLVLTTDPLAAIDIPHMAASDENAVVRMWETGDGATAFLLTKRSSPLGD